MKTIFKFLTVTVDAGLPDLIMVGGVIKEVGAYQILKDVSMLLAGNDLGLQITRLQPGAIRTLYNTKLRNSGLAVFSREWHCEFIETQPREQIDPSSGDFLKVGISFYLPQDTSMDTPLDSVEVNLT